MPIDRDAQVTTDASLAVAITGQHWREALLPSMMVEQVDRLTGNVGIDVWDNCPPGSFLHHPDARRGIVVAMDKDDFDDDSQSILRLSEVTDQGHVVPLLAIER